MPTGISKKVEEFFSKFPLREYDKGELLVLSDENPKYIFYIVSGQIREYDISSHGEEIVVNVFKKPAFIPMSWAIAKIPNRYFFLKQRQKLPCVLLRQTKCSRLLRQIRM